MSPSKHRRYRVGFRRLLALLLPVLALVAVAPAASAHPLGNFTVNSYSGLIVEPSAVAIRLIVDSAEIPTVQQFPTVNSPDGVDSERTETYAAAQCARLGSGLELTVGGTPAETAVESSRLTVLPGQGGLHTMHLTCQMRTTGSVDTIGQRVEYVDTNSLNRTGWREITIAGDGVDLADSTVPATSSSHELSVYPKDLLKSPLDQRAAAAQVIAGDGTLTGAPEHQSGRSAPANGAAANGGWTVQAFTQLVATRDLGIGVALIALLIAIGLGALHAFSPGHGKTLMAAYMLGQRSSLRQVAVIGVTVTLTHTAGVLGRVP